MEFYAPESVRCMYVHWPFCPYKCHFCPFVALASHDQFMGQYHRALLSEIEQYAARTAGDSSGTTPLETLYFGGGTPSTYPNELLQETMTTIRRLFGIAATAEITLEVNPGTVMPGQLAFWQSLGITRLSIGVQSLNDKVLKGLNRHQSARDVLPLLEQASPLFESLSVDLIVGLPGVDADEWRSMVNQIVQWPIQHISVYFLTVHEDTPLYFKVKKKEVTLTPDDDLVDLYTWTRHTLVEHGFGQYEISNFAKPGHQSRHNTVYWQRKPYKAFGLGACSFDGTIRTQNEKNLMRYLQAAEKKESVQASWEALTRQQIHLEKVMLGLRQSTGVVCKDILDGLTADEHRQITDRIASLMHAGLIKDVDGYLILTSEGISVENGIASHLSL